MDNINGGCGFYRDGSTNAPVAGDGVYICFFYNNGGTLLGFVLAAAAWGRELYFRKRWGTWGEWTLIS